MATGLQIESLWNGLTNAAGNPLSGGKVYTYEAGTSSAKATYTDSGLTTPASNPIILDSEGRALIFAHGFYKFVIKDSADNTLYTRDNLAYFYEMSDYLLDYFTGLTELTSIETGDMFVVIDDPAGTPYIKRATLLNVFKGVNNFTALTSIETTDRLLIIDDPTGTPVAKYTTVVDIAEVLSTAVNDFRLIKSGSNLTLERVTGTVININGTLYIVSTLPTLAATGLTPSTLYYIYIYNNAGTITLEASATSFTVGTSGRAEKTGDTTRRLVGLAYCVTGPAWADSATQRLVISYDHKKHIVGRNHFTADRSTTSTSWAEVNTEIRVEFITWADEIVEATVIGPVSASSETRIVGLAIGFDGTTASDYAFEYYTVAGSKCAAARAKKNLTVGYHYATLLGRITATTAYYHGNSSEGEPRFGLSVVIRG